MKKLNLKYLFLLTLILAFLSSCQDAGTSGQARGIATNNGVTGGTDGSSGNGNSAIGNQEAIDNAEIIEEATVEIRHLIEPKIDDNGAGGTYLKKLTIPKNYNGLLYLAGINFSTLADKNIKVRFRFGTGSDPKDVDATLGTATGLTPQTDVQVLILDFASKPFNDVRLGYDLYDYNDYDYTGNGELKPNEPVQLNRDTKLFCRGLKLADDPTFTGNLSNGCVEGTDICKYAYAKVVDQGLVRINSGVKTPITPSEAQIQSGGDTYYEDTNNLKLSRCLPDNPTLYGNTFVFDDSTTFSATNGISAFIDSLEYKYIGPYRLSQTTSWAIGSQAVLGPYGLYSGLQMAGSDAYPYGSKMFPLATKFNLLKDTEYLGSGSPDGARGLSFMAANGESTWMDGCNARATSVESNTGEHVGSCNITSKIEIVKINDDLTEEVITSKDVKLQLVKPTDINSAGEDVLVSSFQSCSSSNQCGSDECCINKRCWDKSLVSQCVEDLPSYGLQEPGSSCSSDYQCGSLCCSQTTGRCAVHDTLQDPPVLCSKGSGQRCIAKEWCAKQPVTRCFIIKTGTDAQGGQTCALRCYTFEEFGDCEDGICKPPPTPEMPTFNPSDPNRCDQACDAPDFSNGYFDFQCGSST